MKGPLITTASRAETRRSGATQSTEEHKKAAVQFQNPLFNVSIFAVRRNVA